MSSLTDHSWLCQMPTRLSYDVLGWKKIVLGQGWVGGWGESTVFSPLVASYALKWHLLTESKYWLQSNADWNQILTAIKHRLNPNVDCNHQTFKHFPTTSRCNQVIVKLTQFTFLAIIQHMVVKFLLQNIVHLKHISLKFLEHYLIWLQPDQCCLIDNS